MPTTRPITEIMQTCPQCKGTGLGKKLSPADAEEQQREYDDCPKCEGAGRALGPIPDYRIVAGKRVTDEGIANTYQPMSAQ